MFRHEMIGDPLSLRDWLQIIRNDIQRLVRRDDAVNPVDVLMLVDKLAAAMLEESAQPATPASGRK